MISVSFGCPYEGRVPPERVFAIAQRLIDAGAQEFGFGDTTGMANPAPVREFFPAAREALGDEIELTAHFHDTRGQGLANVLAALDTGVRSFESSFGELRGCPRNTAVYDARVPLPEFTVTGNGSRADELYANLRRAILDGRLSPGERLVEQSIAKTYAVSRTPVREALHKLTIDKLVENSPRGTIVRSVPLDEFADMCAVRETLEGMAGRLAAQRRSDLDLRAMERAIADLQEATEVDDVERVSALSNRLHDLIARAAGNGYLAKQLTELSLFINRVQGTTLREPTRRRHALDEHSAIVSAIAHSDPEAAERLAREHFHEITSARLAIYRLDGDELLPGNIA